MLSGPVLTVPSQIVIFKEKHSSCNTMLDRMAVIGLTSCNTMLDRMAVIGLTSCNTMLDRMAVIGVTSWATAYETACNKILVLIPNYSMERCGP